MRTDNLKNGAISKHNGDLHGSMARFTCNPGYELIGPNRTLCHAPSANSSWPQAPKCVGIIIVRFCLWCWLALLNSYLHNLFGLITRSIRLHWSYTYASYIHFVSPVLIGALTHGHSIKSTLRCINNM